MGCHSGPSSVRVVDMGEWQRVPCFGFLCPKSTELQADFLIQRLIDLLACTSGRSFECNTYIYPNE